MMTRVLLYSHDTVGLGHSRRILAIASRLSAADPSLTALILTGSTVANTLGLPPNVDFVKLPSVQKIHNGHYEARRLSMRRDEIIGLRKDLIRSAYERFKPDLFIVDKAPVGVHGELRETLGAVARDGGRCRMVLSLRDILDEPGEVVRSWTREGLYQVLEDHYDHILIWGMQEIHDSIEEYRFPPAVAEKVTFCGYLDRATVTDPAPAISAGAKRLVLATVGGGQDGFHLLDVYLESLSSCAQSFASVLITGPDMPEKHRNRLRERLQHVDRPVYALEYTNHFDRFLSAASVVVSMGGCNTVSEIVSRRKPAVIVPRITPRTEQLIRSRQMESLGLVRMLHPEELSPRRLAHEVDALLLAPHSGAVSWLDFDGLDRMIGVLGPYLKGNGAKSNVGTQEATR